MCGGLPFAIPSICSCLQSRQAFVHRFDSDSAIANGSWLPESEWNSISIGRAADFGLKGVDGRGDISPPAIVLQRATIGVGSVISLLGTARLREELKLGTLAGEYPTSRLPRGIHAISQPLSVTGRSPGRRKLKLE